jgi:hypothetical protein
LYRLKNRRERIAVAVFMVFFIAYFSIMPFLMPVFAYSHLSRIETVLDCDNVCLQSNGYSCGPAAAVTVLKQMGVPAEEGALAISAHTTCFAGTPKDSLCSAIRDEYGVLCRIIYVENIDRLVGREPFIAVVKFGFLVDHYVAVLSIKDDFVVVGDPLKGLQRIPGAAFAEMWRKVAIMPDKVVREL